MVAVKERLNLRKDRVTQDRKMRDIVVQVENLSIYEEPAKNGDSLNDGTKGKSDPHSSGHYLPSNNVVKNSDKGKSKADKSVYANTGRRVLADIGNVRRSFSKTEDQINTGAVKCKRGTMMHPLRKGKSEIMLSRANHREAVDLGNVKTSSPGKHSMDSEGLGQIHATDNDRTSKKSVNKNIKSKPNELSTKFEGRNSAAATIRKSARIPLHLTRKSLPVLEASGSGTKKNAAATIRKSARIPLHLTRKSLPVLEASGSRTTKNNPGKSDDVRRKHGFPVKPSVRKSIVPKISTLKRVSDGFVPISRAQTKVETGVLSRKTVKPTVKTAVTSLSTLRNTKSSHVLTTNKLRPKPVCSSKTKQSKASSTSKDVPSLVPHEEPVPEEDISGGTVVIARRKSNRRDSYTSSLMSRSKLIKERGKITSEETLPIIYDDRNHLEVSEYVDDIYQYYWVLEGHNPLLKNYMGNQRDITPQMRGILINWLVEVHKKFDLMEETLFLTVTLLDRYLSLESIKKNEMQLVGLTALLLASKYEDFWHPRVTDLISISAESYTRDQVLNMEKVFLKKLKFRLNEPTPYVFMLRFLKAAQSDTKFEHLAFYLIELCLVEYEALNYKPSMLCASAIYVARCTLRMTPPWTPLLAKHARYEESQIRSCAEMVLRFHKAAGKTSILKVSYEKYSKGDYSRVGMVKALDRLNACFMQE